MRRAKIVSTLGPASSSERVIEQLIGTGVDVFRLNFSHGTREEHAENVGRIRKIADNMQRSVAILQDLQGPKIRVGKLVEDPIELEEGSRLTVTTREVSGDAECVSTTYARLPRDVKPADRILLDDGHIELMVREVQHIIERAEKEIPVIAKLERAEAVDHLEDILDVADGVMVARGDHHGAGRDQFAEIASDWRNIALVIFSLILTPDYS